MGITAGGNIILSKLLMKTQWHVLLSISNSLQGVLRTFVTLFTRKMLYFQQYFQTFMSDYWLCCLVTARNGDSGGLSMFKDDAENVSVYCRINVKTARRKPAVDGVVLFFPRTARLARFIWKYFLLTLI